MIVTAAVATPAGQSHFFAAHPLPAHCSLPTAHACKPCGNQHLTPSKMALSMVQVAFDRLLKDVEEKALEFVAPTSLVLHSATADSLFCLRPPVKNTDLVLLRSYFMSEVGPLVAKKNTLTQAQRMEVAVKAHAILRNYRW